MGRFLFGLIDLSPDVLYHAHISLHTNEFFVSTRLIDAAGRRKVELGQVVLHT